MLNSAILYLTEDTWRHWSKVGLLLQELHRSKVAVQNVTYYRQIAPRSLSTFNYCILVAIDLQTTLDQVKKKKKSNYAPIKN